MMDKTININIAGTLFQIDQEAFRILKDYLQAINNCFKNVKGGHETIEDIEMRISEIFQSHQGLAGAISKENVETMISIIGKPEDFDQSDKESEPPIYSGQRKRLHRNPEDSIIGGVCGGLGAYLNTDPVLFRILFAIFGLFFGTGFFVYIVLWIALPPARTDIQKREMYGDNYHSSMAGIKHNDGYYTSQSTGYNSSSAIGNAFNEIFRAVGRIFYIVMRIFLIIIGAIFTITGFLVILTLIMILVFRFPGAFSNGGTDIHFTYLHDFLGYIVSPSAAPWIIALSFMAVLLPMVALIYGGVKLIFWFRVKDGLIWLIGFVVWILIFGALAILLFNEGFSFAERGRVSSINFLSSSPDTIYVITKNSSSDLKYDKEFSLPDEEYSILMADSAHQLFIPARLRLNIAEDSNAKIEITKRAHGRTRTEATRKAESIIYNYQFINDTLFLDEYFTLPAGSRWSADFLNVNLTIPENTVLYFDNPSERLFQNELKIGKVEDNIVTDSKYDADTESWELGNKYWIISEEGLKETNRAASIRK